VPLHNKTSITLPQIGDVVTASVSRITQSVAYVSILCVGGALLAEPFQGTIRERDVRSFEVDDVDMYKSYRPGDVVRAKVISLGDARSYFLSTAANDLGVVLANSEAGHTMVPVSWRFMRCPVTRQKERRKVAKVDGGAADAAGAADAVASP
jgi:exosome complex component CSL4